MHDVIVLDAFSSDSIPIHLLTREAVDLYLTRLDDGRHPCRSIFPTTISTYVPLSPA